MKAKVIGIDADRDIAVLQLLQGKSLLPGADGPPKSDTPVPPLKPVPESGSPPPAPLPQSRQVKRDRRFLEVDSKLVPAPVALMVEPQVKPPQVVQAEKVVQHGHRGQMWVTVR